MPNGGASDMVNLTRAKDAAQVLERPRVLDDLRESVNSLIETIRLGQSPSCAIRRDILGMRQFSRNEPDRHLVNIFKCDRTGLHVASSPAAKSPYVGACEE
jgi:hypothetical protein